MNQSKNIFLFQIKGEKSFCYKTAVFHLSAFAVESSLREMHSQSVSIPFILLELYNLPFYIVCNEKSVSIPSILLELYYSPFYIVCKQMCYVNCIVS
jgi:hypothetical protein